MVGFPYNTNLPDVEISLSEAVCSNSRIFISGVLVGASFSPGTALAMPDGVANPGFTPGPAPASNVTTAANVLRGAVIVGACAVTAECGNKGAEQIINKAAQTPTAGAIAIIACTFVAGWCVGQVIDKAIKKAL